MAFVVYNTFTNSPVTHGEAWVTVVFETLGEAHDYAKSLRFEYIAKRGKTPDTDLKFQWSVRSATPYERQAALRAGIFGKEWAQVLGKGQMGDLD